MLVARLAFSLFVIGGQLYIVGGLGACLYSTACFDPVAGIWQTLAPMSLERSAFSSSECFDPVAGIWQTLTPMSVAPLAHSLFVFDGQLYIAGGLGVCLNSTVCFDPVVGIWQTLTPMSLE